MKKLLLFVMLGMMFVTQATLGNTTRVVSPAPVAVWIRLDIIFHRPKLNCERGFGICFLTSAGFSMSDQGIAEKRGCPVRGMLNEKNQLLIEVEEAELTRYEGGSALPYFKDRTSVTIPDPYMIPEGTCRALGANGPLVIKPGTYPVYNTNRVYTVTIQL